MKIDKRSLVNILGLTTILLLWFTGTETFAGGLCNYWRCVDSRVMIIPILSVVLLLINIMFLLIIMEEK